MDPTNSTRVAQNHPAAQRGPITREMQPQVPTIPSGSVNSRQNIRSPSGLNPAAPSFRSFQTQTPNPSRRFRPTAEDVSDEGDPYYPSPPQWFSTPEAVDEFSTGVDTPSMGSSAVSESMSSTRSPPKDYRGVHLRPGQLPSLTPYGLFGSPALPNSNAPGFAPSINSGHNQHRAADLLAARSLDNMHLGQDSSLVRGDHRSGVNTTSQNSPSQFLSGGDRAVPEPRTMVRDASHQPSIQESTYSSNQSIHPSHGVAVSDSDPTMPVMPQHQTHDFAQLASAQRVREWNNSVFDDRWISRPGEMYHLGGPNSVSTANAGQSSTRGAERPAPQTVTSQPSSQQNRGGNNARAESTAQRTLETLPSTRYNLGNERRTRNVDQNRNSFLGLLESRQPSGNGLDGALENYGAYMAALPSGEELREERARIHPTPPEVARLDECVRDLDRLTEDVPLAITEPDVIHHYICERVFNDRFPIPLRGPEGDKLTKRHGRVMTCRTLRDQMLSEIHDLVEYVLSPIGEGFRMRADARLAKASTEGTGSYTYTRGVEASPSQPFSGGVELLPSKSFSEPTTAVNNRNLSPAQLAFEAEASSAMGTLFNQHRNMRPKTTPAEALAQGKACVDQFLPQNNKPQDGFEEDSAMRKAQVERLRSGTKRTSVSNPSNEPRVDANAGPTGSQPFLPFGVPQQFQYGPYPGMVFAAPGFHGHMPQIQQPWVQHPWAFQQHAGAFQHPAHPASQPTPYGYPFWLPGFPQPAPGYLTSQPSMASQSGFVPPTMPWGSNTIDPTAAQARELPSAVTQNIEWQNRYGAQPTVVPDMPVLPYRPGCDTMYPRPTGTASIRYQNLTRDDPPCLNVATAEENLPFAENARNSQPGKWGVVKVGNIPYDLTKASILNFLGPHAKIITTDLGPPIHIIMDRSTGKTMDCYIEFFSGPDARVCVNALNLRPTGQNRIGDRVVDVSMSNQEELMRELFPKAKNVRWDGARPVIQEATELFNTGFKTFVSSEELGCLVRHAEQPHRSNYTQRSPQRTYEALISLLAKFPWAAVDCYTLATRTQIFQATRQMLHILSINVRKTYSTPVTAFSSLSVQGGGQVSHGGIPLLTEGLLKDLLLAGLNASGFSEKQRWELFEMSDYARRQFRISPMLQHWPFEVLGRKPHMDEDVVKFYAEIISCSPITTHPDVDSPFGSIKTVTENIDLDVQTMEMVGEMERKMLFAMVEAFITGDMGDEMDEVWAWSNGGGQ